METLVKNDVIVLGILMLVLGLVFTTAASENKFWKRFYTFIPPIFLCYFIPGLFNSFGLISGSLSGLNKMASTYLLPASLVLLTLGLDFPSLRKLGGKAVLIFFAGTLGIILGGPIALSIGKLIHPEAFAGTGPDEVWRGMATIAGSWIGGGANQAAMKEMFQPSAPLFSGMIAVDVLVANVLMALLLFMAGKNDRINRFLNADTRSLDEVKARLVAIRNENARIPSSTDLMKIAAVGIVPTGLAHLLANRIGPYLGAHFPELSQKLSLSSTFFWMVLLVSLFGILLSLTPLKKLEGAGASKVGTVFLYILVATIGMNMDVLSIFDTPVFFLVGFIWILFHLVVIFLAAKLTRAPLFFVAVGSQANVGGAASAPVVASAFDSALAPVGAILAVLGYAIGTYGAYISALIMQAIY